VQQPRFSPDGNHLSFLSDQNGYQNLWVVDAKDFGRPWPLFEESFDNGDLTWGPGQSAYAWMRDGESVAISRVSKGFCSLVERSLVKSEIVHRYTGNCTNVGAVGGDIVAMRSDFSYPAELVVMTDGDSRTFARGAYVGVEAGAITPEHVSWTSFDGTEIRGRLYKGETDKLLVSVHGGPHGLSPATFNPRWQYFIDRGWSVLVPDYRGTSGYGRAFLQSLRGRWGEVDVEDVASGVRAAMDNGWGSRIALTGSSAGGLTVLLVMAKYPDLALAGIAIYPVTDCIEVDNECWRFEAHYFESVLGKRPLADPTYVERSPITHAASITKPVLLLHGDADVVVPCSQSERLAKAIEAAGGTAELHIYEGEGHGWRSGETSADELQRVEAFLSKYVTESG
jgi:dipeptidyl aminopeptidase/acylaminoacyl peptidase